MTPENLIEREKRLLAYDGPDRVVSSTELSEHFSKQVQTAKQFTTGIAPLDEAIEGIETGELIVVSGPTSHGKTLLCDTIARNLRYKGDSSVFFPFETTARKFVQWHNSPHSVVFLPQENKLADLAWLRDRCEEGKLKHGCRVAVIDHLHFIIDMATRNNMSLEIGTTMRFLKREIALSLDMAVIIVCHIGKIPLEQMDREPSIAFLRDSSFVGQEADTVLMVWRRCDRDPYGKSLDSWKQGLATIKIEKARRTGRIREKIKVKKEGLCLVESLDEPEEEKRPARSRRGAYGFGGQDYASGAEVEA